MGQADPHVWEAVVTHLRKAHPGMCRRWFDDIELLELDSGTLKLLVREPVQLKYLQHRCQKEFTEASQAVLQRLVAVRFVGEAEAASRPTNGTKHAPTTNGTEFGFDDEMLISPDYSFETFVEGPRDLFQECVELLRLHGEDDQIALTYRFRVVSARHVALLFQVRELLGLAPGDPDVGRRETTGADPSHRLQRLAPVEEDRLRREFLFRHLPAFGDFSLASHFSLFVVARFIEQFHPSPINGHLQFIICVYRW